MMALMLQNRRCKCGRHHTRMHAILVQFIMLSPELKSNQRRETCTASHKH